MYARPQCSAHSFHHHTWSLWRNALHVTTMAYLPSMPITLHVILCLLHYPLCLRIMCLYKLVFNHQLQLRSRFVWIHPSYSLHAHTFEGKPLLLTRLLFWSVRVKNRPTERCLAMALLTLHRSPSISTAPVSFPRAPHISQGCFYWPLIFHGSAFTSRHITLCFTVCDSIHWPSLLLPIIQNPFALVNEHQSLPEAVQ